MTKTILTFLSCLLLTTATAGAAKKSVFLYAGQSNADGREYTTNLPSYMMQSGSLPSSPYTHLQWASICGNPSASTFGTRTFNSGERYAFCDVTNYWIDQAATDDFYAIKCAYGGTAIAPGVTAEKLPIWYADATWMQTHNAYCGQDITQEAYKNNNSLTKNLTEGFASLVDGTLAALDAGYDVKAILWHQGESDRNASGQYYTNFKTMIAYMRQAIYAKTGDEADLTLPFIFGTVCRRSTQYNATVEAAQKQVAAEDDNCYVIDMKNATLLSDNLHFDRQATEYLGKKMYNQLVALGLVPGGTAVDVEEFAVEESPMDNVVVPSPDNRSWDFSSFSETTLNALKDNVSGNKDWNSASGWGYRYGHQLNVEQLMVDGTVVPETKGLYFTSAQANRVCILSNWLGFRTSDATVYIPKLTAGQLITFTLRGATGTVDVNPNLDTQSLVELVSDSKTVGTTVSTVTYRVRYNVTLPTHMGFTMGGAYVQKIQIKTPETVNILIGADQKETFSCDQPLDFSPFVDLFKAYVVTGYDDTTGKIDCEQVLQVPANTGVLLVGEESTVNAPIIEGDAPEAPVTNLLTAVVGSGSAPTNSFVLTTTGGVTQFTKAANAVSLNNQAYIASLGSLDAYDFNLMEAKTEHVYDNAGGSILSKGTILTFTDVEHHTMSNGKKVYGPANAIGLDGRFAFDNSGNWKVESSGQLGQTYDANPYMSVVELVNGDRVQFTTMNGSLRTVNAVLRGVAAGTDLTSGTTYMVVAPAGEKVNLDLRLIKSSNRNGFTKVTVWTSTETTPIYAVSTPTASVELQQVREGLYTAVATLTATNSTDAPITYYYKGGDAADWTALADNTFTPTQKAEYQFKATASGYADSQALTLSLGYRYALTKTVVDLSDEAVFTASTKDTSGFNWKDAKYVMMSGMPAETVYGHISSATAITGLTLQDNNTDARYSFAKGYGLACNYGYWVKTTGATTYDFAEYEVYDTNTSEINTTKVIVHDPNNTAYSFKPIKTVRLYEPVEMASITIQDIGYATYCSESALDFTGSGVEAFYATADGDNVDFTNAITNPAAETGLLLKAPEGTYEVIKVASGTDVSAVNKLQACLTEKTVGTTEGCDYGKVFILSKHNGTLGFYRSNNGRTLQAGKSFLYLTDVTEARADKGFPFDNTSSILAPTSLISTPSSPTKVYDLQGNLFTLHSSLKKGIVIVGGKKMVMK